MLRLVWKFFKACFILFCIVGAMLMTVWLVYQYTLDKDVSSIDFKNYHNSDKELYPSITMCFGESDKFSLFKTTQGFNNSAYVNFLSGCDEKLLGNCRSCCNIDKEGTKYEKYSNLLKCIAIYHHI